MRVKEGFIVKNVADAYAVVPVGDNLVDFGAMLTLNETGAFLWKHLENDITAEQLCEALMGEYNVDKVTAQRDIAEFLNILDSHEILER